MDCSNILLVRVDKLGDLIYTIPAFRSVKNYYQSFCNKGKIYILTSKYNWQLGKWLANEFDGIIKIDPNLKYDKEAISQIKNLQIKKALFFWFHPNVACSLKSLGIKIIGRGSNIKSAFCLDSFIFQRRHNVKMHELYYNLELVQKFLTVPRYLLTTNFFLSLNIKKNFNLQHFGKYIIIHPLNGGSGENLSFKKYIEIIKIFLSNTKDYKVILTGTKSDKIIIDKFITPFITNDRLINLSGKLDFDTFLYIIQNAKLLLSSSTGPLHIAASFGIPTIGIFAPIKSQHPKRWSPSCFVQNSYIFYPILKCPTVFRCKKYKCSYYDCLNLINENDIVNMIFRMLNTKKNFYYNKIDKTI